MKMPDQQLILVTGATGYIGSRLIPVLLEQGYRVRCLVRDPARLNHHPWLPKVEIFRADLTDFHSVEIALAGVSTAYYLVHNMASGPQYSDKDIVSARNFSLAASSAGLEHIIYLGGLVDPSAKIGSHLRSRLETGDTLRQGTVPVTEFRASIIIGSGSTAYEMIRFITELFPILLGPPWLENRSQPIAIKNILEYLLAALETPTCRGEICEIGGVNVITYAETLTIYAHQRGLRRYIVHFPYVPVRLMSYFVDKLTPVRASYANPLIDSMRSDSVINSNSAQQLFPNIIPLGYESTISEIINKNSPAQIEPIWGNKRNLDIIIKHEGFLIDCRKDTSQISPEAVYSVITGLGGKRGWLYLNWLWQLRGWLDRLLGGPGMRGRQEVKDLAVDDVLDFYRVEALEPERLMRLRAELKAPGQGWMEWRINVSNGGGAELTQLAYFAPRGLAGFLYWYLLHPIHRLVFSGLINRIAYQAAKHDPSPMS